MNGGLSSSYIKPVGLTQATSSANLNSFHGHFQDTVSASAANVIAIKASRALPASAKCQRKAASSSTTPSAMAEGGAGATAASVWRVTSVHTARPVWAAPTPAS